MLASSASPTSSPHLTGSRRASYHQTWGRVSPHLRSPNLTRSPKQSEQPLRKDAGTQYTPDDYPPTDKRSLVKVEQLAGTVGKERARPAPDENSPPEPSLKVDPQPAVTSNNGIKMEATPPVAATTPAIMAESPSKRARAESSADKVMPKDYSKADVRDLGKIIASMLGELVRINDKIPLQDGKLTRWHSRAPPGISVRDYLLRLIVHATLSAPILLSMVYYLDCLCNRYPTFTLTSLTVHRFLISAATVAAKGLSDSFWTNNTYARVGGVSIKELALLELELLQKLDWRIVPKPEVLEDYYRSLVERTEGFIMEKP